MMVKMDATPVRGSYQYSLPKKTSKLTMLKLNRTCLQKAAMIDTHNFIEHASNMDAENLPQLPAT